MKQLQMIVLTVVPLTLLFSCKKESVEPTSYPDFTMLKTGNYWIYEKFIVDTAGLTHSTETFDSCYIEKDTIINNRKYFKFVRPQPVNPNIDFSYVRDSNSYLVNIFGKILFSSQNFSDIFDEFYVLHDETDTICRVYFSMEDKNLTVSTPAGQFATYNFRQTYQMYPGWQENGNPRYLNYRYAINVGIVIETLPIYAGNPNYVERRLVRYHIN